jgi:hypothetical protein
MYHGKERSAFTQFQITRRPPLSHTTQEPEGRTLGGHHCDWNYSKTLKLAPEKSRGLPVLLSTRSVRRRDGKAPSDFTAPQWRVLALVSGIRHSYVFPKLLAAKSL